MLPAKRRAPALRSKTGKSNENHEYALRICALP